MSDRNAALRPRSWPHRVGVVGPGRMGPAMASNLVDDGLNVADPLADLRDCDVVLTSRPDDRAPSAVTLDKLGLPDVLKTGAVYLSMSTISPDLPAHLQAEHAASGQAFPAAPVLGTPDLAGRRKLFVILGGESPTRTRILPLLERLGQRVFPAGAEAAHASLLKLAGNALTAATLQSMGEIQGLRRKADIDPQIVFDLLTGPLFDGKVHKTYGGKILAQPYPGRDDAAPGGQGSEARPGLCRTAGLAASGRERWPWSPQWPAVGMGLTGRALGLLAAQEAGIDDPVPPADGANEVRSHG